MFATLRHEETLAPSAVDASSSESGVNLGGARAAVGGGPSRARLATLRAGNGSRAAAAAASSRARGRRRTRIEGSGGGPQGACIAFEASRGAGDSRPSPAAREGAPGGLFRRSGAREVCSRRKREGFGRGEPAQSSCLFLSSRCTKSLSTDP
jgi:hypothetical protein